MKFVEKISLTYYRCDKQSSLTYIQCSLSTELLGTTKATEFISWLYVEYLNLIGRHLRIMMAFILTKQHIFDGAKEEIKLSINGGKAAIFDGMGDT